VVGGRGINGSSSLGMFSTRRTCQEVPSQTAIVIWHFGVRSLDEKTFLGSAQSNPGEAQSHVSYLWLAIFTYAMDTFHLRANA